MKRLLLWLPSLVVGVLLMVRWVGRDDALASAFAGMHAGLSLAAVTYHAIEVWKARRAKRRLAALAASPLFRPCPECGERAVEYLDGRALVCTSAYCASRFHRTRRDGWVRARS